jgi:uncharacterized protein (DUF427 family)
MANPAPGYLKKPEHRVDLLPEPRRVRVTFAGQVVADTTAALALREADYPAVQYIPRADVDFTQLERTDHQTYCPYKGDASYYSVLPAGADGVNAVWTYEQPYDAVADIREHLAFYPDKVSIEIIA